MHQASPISECFGFPRFHPGVHSDPFRGTLHRSLYINESRICSFGMNFHDYYRMFIFIVAGGDMLTVVPLFRPQSTSPKSEGNTWQYPSVLPHNQWTPSFCGNQYTFSCHGKRGDLWFLYRCSIVWPSQHSLTTWHRLTLKPCAMPPGPRTSSAPVPEALAQRCPKPWQCCRSSQPDWWCLGSRDIWCK